MAAVKTTTMRAEAHAHSIAVEGCGTLTVSQDFGNCILNRVRPLGQMYWWCACVQSTPLPFTIVAALRPMP
jgi:hypothetical protein